MWVDPKGIHSLMPTALSNCHLDANDYGEALLPICLLGSFPLDFKDRVEFIIVSESSRLRLVVNQLLQHAVDSGYSHTKRLKAKSDCKRSVTLHMLFVLNCRGIILHF